MPGGSSPKTPTQRVLSQSDDEQNMYAYRRYGFQLALANLREQIRDTPPRASALPKISAELQALADFGINESNPATDEQLHRLAEL